MDDEPAAKIAESPSADRLDSWKSIASYLNRDVRTVQRWEAREGMPVHRHQHDQLASVYASKGELDAWRRSRTKAENALGVSDADPPAMARRFTTHRSVVAAVCLLAVIAAVVVLWRYSPILRPSQSAPPRTWTLLMADVDAPADIASLANELRQQAIAAWRSSGGDVVPTDRIGMFLDLMRQPSQAQLTSALASELAVRAGRVHVVGVLTIDRQGSLLRPTLRALSGGGSHREVARLEGVPVAIDALPELVRDLTARLAAQVSASAPEAAAGFLRVTTAALPALQQYDEADHLMRRGLWKAAVPLLQDAIASDSAFASAHIHLAWVLSNLNQPRQQWEPHIVRAEALQNQVSAAERWFIVGSAQSLRGNPAGSMSSWERVLQLAPEHFWALGNLSIARYSQGNVASGNELAVARARAHPEDLVSQVMAAEILLKERRGADAHEVLERATRLAGSATSGERFIADVSLPLAEACDAWLRQDIVTARAAADRAAAALTGIGPAEAPHHFYSVGLMYLGLGMARQARRMVESVVGHGERDHHLALVLAIGGDRQETQKLLRSMGPTYPRLSPAAAPLFVEFQLPAEAAALLARWDRERYWPDALVAPLRAALLADHGQRDAALRALDLGVPLMRNENWPDRWISSMPSASIPLFAAERLQARLLAAAGHLDAAIGALEAGRKDIAVACNATKNGSAYYLAMLVDLLRLYRERGDQVGVKTVEAELRTRLAFANPDFPLLAALSSSATSFGTRAAGNDPLQR